MVRMIKVTARLLALAAGALLSACEPSAVAPTSSDEPATHSSVAKGDESAPIMELFRFVDYRYTELERPTDLNKLPFVDVTTMGEVASFEAGPAQWSDLAADPEAEVEGETSGLPSDGTASEVPSGRNVIMHVRVTDIAKGEGQVSQEIPVLLPTHEGQTAKDFEEALAPGTPVVVYLSRATDWPDAVGLWKPASPQGFIVESPDDAGILYPLAHDTEESTLATVFPR